MKKISTITMLVITFVGFVFSVEAWAAKENVYSAPVDGAAPLAADGSTEQEVVSITCSGTQGGVATGNWAITINGTVASTDIAGVYIYEQAIPVLSGSTSNMTGFPNLSIGSLATKAPSPISIRVILNATADGKTVGVSLTADGTGSELGLPQSSSNLAITAPAANNSPSLTVSQPDGVGDAVTQGASFNITYDLSDSEDTATVDFYYEADGNGAGGIAIAACQNQAEGSGATCAWDTTSIAPANYYVYGVADDTVNALVTVVSSGTLTINAPVNNPPSLTVSQPDGVGDAVTQGNSYNITYDLSDNEDTATVDFYYETDGNGAGGTLIAGCQNQAEGAGATCAWDTTSVTPNNYYVYGVADDTVNSLVTIVSSGTLTINAANASPTLTVNQPDGVGDTVTVGDNFTIDYDMNDGDSVATVTFFYDANTDMAGGTQISGACSGAAEGTGAICLWDTTGMTPGSYYVYGEADDTVNALVKNVSSGTVTINGAPVCTPVAPTLMVSNNQSVKSAEAAVYTVTVINNDNVLCASTDFEVTINSETDAANAFDAAVLAPADPATVSVVPGASDNSITLTVTGNGAGVDDDFIDVELILSDPSAEPAHTNQTKTPRTTIANFNPMIHSSASTGSTKWGSNWGTTTGKYGEFTCATCHARGTGNVKRVKAQIASATADKFPNEVGVNSITFSDTRDGLSDYGNDLGGHATSTSICEGCHSQNKYHNYDTANNTNGLTHQNQQDCITCHLHSEGFKGGGCDSCHGNPPVTNDIDGSTTTGLVHNPSATGGTSPASAGAHAIHTDDPGQAMTCDTCHKGNTMPTVSDTIQMGFEINGTNWTGFGATIVSGSLNVPQDINLTNSFAFISSDGGTSIVKQNIDNPTCAVYCHGDWTGNGGQTTTDWVGGTTMTDDCNDCHGGSATTPPATGSHTVHAGDGVGGLALACNSCHPTYSAGNVAHINGDVAWDVSGLTGTAPVYSGSASGFTGAKAPSGSFSTCSGVACHDNALGVEAATPVWGTVITDCSECHPTIPGTASHGKHVTTTTYAKAVCADCHASAVQGTTAPVGHLDGNLDVLNGYPANEGKGGAPYSSCTTAYCHSTGQSTSNGGSAVPTYAIVTWGGGAACGTCHKVTEGTGLTSGSHAAHLGTTGVNGCADCHTGAANDAASYATTIHVDGAIDVANSYGSGGTPGNGYGTCTAASCHHNGVDAVIPSPIWGAVVSNCADCHATIPATASHAKHVTTTTYAKAVCADCHSGAVQGTTASTGHLDGDLDVLNGYPANEARGGAPYKTCTTAYCHSTGQSTSNGGSAVPAYATVTWGGSAACGSCHKVTEGTGLTSGGHAAHLGAAGVNGCGDCHTDAANDAASYASIAHVDGVIDVANSYASGGAPGNGYGICTNASCHDDGTGTPADSPIWGVTVSDCSECHPNQPSTGSHSTHMTQTISPAISCGTCHSNAVQGTTAPTGHLDGNLDALYYPANEPKGGSPYSSCSLTYCHGDAMPFGDSTGSDVTPLWGASSTGCDFCHGYPPTPAGTHNGVPTDGTTCGDCHNQTMNAGAPTFKDSALHINSNVEVDVTCTGCHGGGGPGAKLVSENSTHSNVAMSTATAGAISTCEDCHFDNHTSRGTGTVDIPWDTRTMGAITAAEDALDSIIYLKGSGSEAEVCWACHLIYSISEWNSTASSGARPAGYLSAGGPNWIGATWDSANFSYKTNSIVSVHETQESTVNPAVVTDDTDHIASPDSGQDAVADISCSACHDVHSIADGNTDAEPAPYLRGTWTSNPFPEDGAPQTTAHATTWGGVPRAGLGAAEANLGDSPNALGGWQIEQNNPGAYTQVSSYATHSGLCSSCHSQTNLQGLAWTGHDAAVDGFSGGTRVNIFRTSTRGGTGNSQVRGYMQQNNSTNTTSTKYPLGLRTEYYGADYLPSITAGSDPQYGSNIDQTWGLSIDDGTTDPDFHQFACSKCHDPHASRLPRLMITNCLDVVQNTWDDTNADDPSTWVGATNNPQYTFGAHNAKQLAYSSTAVNCHRYVDAGASANEETPGTSEAGWNLITPW